MNDNACINALVIAVRNDMSRGLKKEEILKALSRVVSRDLFYKVLQRL
jgi:hypothetical protein